MRSQGLLAYHGCVACGNPQLYNRILPVFPEDWFWKSQAARTGWHSMMMQLAGTPVCNPQRLARPPEHALGGRGMHAASLQAERREQDY